MVQSSEIFSWLRHQSLSLFACKPSGRLDAEMPEIIIIMVMMLIINITF